MNISVELAIIVCSLFEEGILSMKLSPGLTLVNDT